MKKLLTGAIAIAALLGVSSCSSDKSSSSGTTTASADSTAGSTAGSAAAGGSVHDQAIASMIAAPPSGVTFDDACFTKAMAALSDADAQLIVDAGPTGNPTLSAEGTALATAAVTSCGTLTPTAST